jgi:hypothetical protein
LNEKRIIQKQGTAKIANENRKKEENRIRTPYKFLVNLKIYISS